MSDPTIIAAFIGAVGVIVAALITLFQQRKNQRSSVTEVSGKKVNESTLQSSGTMATDKTKQEQIHRRSITDLTHEQIVENIERVPPLQRDDITKHYKGIRVERIGKLRNARRRDDGSLSVSLSFLNQDGSIWCDASPDDCPDLAFVHEGTTLRVVGEISEVSKYEEKLLDCEISRLRKPASDRGEIPMIQVHGSIKPIKNQGKKATKFVAGNNIQKSRPLKKGGLKKYYTRCFESKRWIGPQRTSIFSQCLNRLLENYADMKLLER